MAETKRSYTIFGKGRRLSPELKARVMHELKNGARPFDVERKYRLSYFTVAKLRRLIGDIPGPVGRKRKLSQKVLELAEQRLRNGEKLYVVAADVGVHVHTLQNRLTFRKRAKR
ncbi:MAG: hypothetical protein WA857_21820 [Candidatus Acidiferrum sp.]